MRLLPLLPCLLLIAASSPITAEDLVLQERYWPYQASLVEPFQPAGRDAALPAKRLGVVVRVRPDETARIDFGRLGRHDVPVRSTDLVERANLIRHGEIRKLAPNFVLSIRTRLVRFESQGLRPVAPSVAGAHSAFLCAFADPMSEQFPALAEALQALPASDSAMTILVPQGGHADLAVAERLHELGWSPPFVAQRFARAETEAQLEAGLSPPAILVQSDEGRLLRASAWRPGIEIELPPDLRRASAARAADSRDPSSTRP
jgi:hypothetical protein